MTLATLEGFTILYFLKWSHFKRENRGASDPFFVWRRTQETAVRMVPEGSGEEEEEEIKEEEKGKGGKKARSACCTGRTGHFGPSVRFRKRSEEMAILSLQVRRFRNQTEGSGLQAASEMFGSLRTSPKRQILVCVG